jgi:serine protease Do
LNDSRGFLVTEVTAGSPAAGAGIRGGDVLTAVNGRQIELGGDIIVAADNITVREIDDLLAYLETEKSVGENVVLGIIRDGRALDIGVTLAPRPTGQERQQETEEAAGEQRARPTLGVNTVNMSENIAEMMNLTLLQDTQDDFAGKGVLVVDVLSGGPAEEAGIRGGYIVTNIDGDEIELGGDVIVAIDDTRIPSIDALRTFVEEKNIGDTIQVTVIRDNQEVVLPVTLGSTLELNTDQLQPNNGSAFSIEPPEGPPSGFLDDLYGRCLEALGPSVCDPIFGR